MAEPRKPILGRQVELFQPSQQNIAAGIIFILLLNGGGLLLLGFLIRGVYVARGNLPFWAEKGMCWFAVVIGSLIGAFLIFAGILVLRFVLRLSRYKVEVYELGFRIHERNEVSDVSWAEISHIRETVLYERPPLLTSPAKFLLPKVASTKYTVITKAGKELTFDGNAVDGIKRLGALFREIATKAKLHWEKTEEHS